ncbi:MAG: hypothetical protein PHO10_01925 [Gemmiger sp.]|nr:hypothetical protein [Gemmiger sp.]
MRELRAGGTAPVQGVLFKAFHGVFALLLLFLVVAGVASWQYNGPAALVAGLVLGLMLALGYRLAAPLVDALPAGRFRLVMAGVAAAYLALLLVLGNAMAEVLISDMGVVYDTLAEFLAYGHPVQNNDYYIICNNNLGLALVLYGFYALAGWFGIRPDAGAGITAGICLNCVCIFVAMLLFSYAARLLASKQSVQLLFLCCAALFAPLYLWSPYFYSDTLCLPWLAGALVLYLRWQQSPGLSPGWALAFGGAVFVGYAIKGSVVVVLVAGLLVLLVAPPKAATRTRLAGAAAAMLFTFVGLWGGYQAFQAQYLDWADREAVCFPTELWLCYGSHGEGDYADEDANDCRLQPTLDARQALMRQRIAENYAARTPVGNLDFILHKAVRTWGDGEYGAPEYLAAPLRPTFAARFVLYGQPGFMPLLYYCQAWQYLLLALNAVGALLALRGGAASPLRAAFLPRLALFGAIFFFSFWETKPRYALHFAPVLLLCGVLALAQLATRRQKAPAKEFAVVR